MVSRVDLTRYCSPLTKITKIHLNEHICLLLYSSFHAGREIYTATVLCTGVRSSHVGNALTYISTSPPSSLLPHIFLPSLVSDSQDTTFIIHFKNILTIAAIASLPLAGYFGYPTKGGNHVATGDKDSAKKPAQHYIRHAARKHSGDHAAKYAPKHDHHTHDTCEHGEKKGDAYHHEGKIDRRNGGVYWCTEINWKSTCQKVLADNKYHKWTPGIKGSFGPDQGVSCTFYEADDCSGPTTSVKYPEKM